MIEVKPKKRNLFFGSFVENFVFFVLRRFINTKNTKGSTKWADAC